MTRVARYATVCFEQNRYGVYESQVMRKKTTYGNKLTLIKNIVHFIGSSGVVQWLGCWIVTHRYRVRCCSRF